jgi:hypothetical protein
MKDGNHLRLRKQKRLPSTAFHELFEVNPATSVGADLSAPEPDLLRWRKLYRYLDRFLALLGLPDCNIRREI